MGETFNLLFRKRANGTFELQARDSWSGNSITGDFLPPYTPRQLNSLLKKLNKLESDNHELREIGYRLFLALCGTDTADPISVDAGFEADSGRPVQDLLRSVITRVLRRRGTIALILTFAVGCDDFARYPWELLHNGEHFLLASGVFTLTRAFLRPDVPVGCELPVHPPLRMLYIGSSPCDQAPLDIERSFGALERGLSRLRSNGQLLLDRLEPPTFSELVRYLSSYGGANVLNDSETLLPCYVIHFDGHGARGRLCPEDGCATLNEPEARKCSACGASLSRVSPQTYLCFCNDDGYNEYIDTLALRELLVSSDVRLAVFSACETAALSPEKGKSHGQHSHRVTATTESSLATSLLIAQVPAVVAMPYSLHDELGPTFMFHFYESLADGRTLEEALSRTRQAMLPGHQSWFIPVLYRHVAEGQEGPVALLAGPASQEESEHPLEHLGASTLLIGRERELHELEELLIAAAYGSEQSNGSSQNHYKLKSGMHHLALTGPAGIGKSALAFEAVRRNREKFPGGVIGISLQGGKSFGDALSEIVQRMHISERPVIPADPVMRGRTVLSVLRSRASRELSCLLFIDAFEEAIQSDLNLWFRFLCMLPEQIVVLVTSRSNPATVSITEGNMCRWYEYNVGKMTDEDLLKLFLELASASGLDHRIHLENPDQQNILRDICRLLDGYPLGAELIFGTARSIHGKLFAPEAATRSLEEVRDELRETPLAGIWAVLEVAYLRLSPIARLLLSYLAAFKLPFSRKQIVTLVAPETLASVRAAVRLARDYVGENASMLESDAAQADTTVIPAELSQQWPAARDELVQASFMQFDGQLYTIHPQVRNFALAYLPPEERQRVHRVSAAYYSSLSHPTPEEWFVAFEHLEGAGEVEDLEKAVRLAVRSSWATSGKGRILELLSVLRRAEAHSLRLGDTTGEGQIQCCLGALSRLLGRHAEAVACLTRSLALHKAADEQAEAAWALYELAVLLREEGQFQLAETRAQEALAYFKQAGDKSGESWIQIVQGEIYYGYGRYQEALVAFNQAQNTFRSIYVDEGYAASLLCRGNVHEAQGRFQEALSDYDEALRLFKALGLQAGAAWAKLSQGSVFIQQEQYQKAEAVCVEALAVFRGQGIRRGEAWALCVIGEMKRAQYIEDAQAYLDEAFTIFEALGDRADMAHVLNLLGELAFNQGDYPAAREYSERVLAMAHELKSRPREGRALRNLGDVARTLRHLNAAQNFYHEAATIASELQTPLEMSGILRRQGELYSAQGSYEDALEAWLQALKLDTHEGTAEHLLLEEKVEALVREQHLEKAYARQSEQ